MKADGRKLSRECCARMRWDQKSERIFECWQAGSYASRPL